MAASSSGIARPGCSNRGRAARAWSATNSGCNDHVAVEQHHVVARVQRAIASVAHASGAKARRAPGARTRTRRTTRRFLNASTTAAVRGPSRRRRRSTSSGAAGLCPRRSPAPARAHRAARKSSTTRQRRVTSATATRRTACSATDSEAKSIPLVCARMSLTTRACMRPRPPCSAPATVERPGRIALARLIRARRCASPRCTSNSASRRLPRATACQWPVDVERLDVPAQPVEPEIPRRCRSRRLAAAPP